MAKKKQNRRKAAKKTKKKQKKARQVGFFGWLFFWPYHLVSRLVAGWPALFRRPIKLAAIGAAAGFFVFLGMAIFYFSRALPYDLTEVRKMPERTTVLDRTGKEIARLHGENRTIIPLSQIAPEFEDCLLYTSPSPRDS